MARTLHKLMHQKSELEQTNKYLKANNSRLKDENVRLKSGYTQKQINWLLSNESIKELRELKEIYPNDKTSLMKEWRKNIEAHK